MRADLERRIGALGPTQRQVLRQRAAGLLAAPPAAGSGGGSAGPASAFQQRLLHLERLAPGTGLHNLVLGVDVPPGTTPQLATKSLAELARRHPLITACFDDEQIRTTGAPEVGWESRSVVHDREVLRTQKLAAAATGFDISTGPLARAAVWVGGDGHVAELLLIVHRLAADGWSARILVDDLGALLAGGTPNAPAPMREYADYSRWLERHLTPAFVGEAVDGWARSLHATSPGLGLRGVSDEAAPSFVGARFACGLGCGVEALDAVSRRAGVTRFSAMFAAFVGALSAHSAHHAFRIGMPAANRVDPAFATVVGPFANTTMVAAPAWRGESGAEAVRASACAVATAQASAAVPFDLVAVRLDAEGFSRQQLFATTFYFDPDSASVASAVEDILDSGPSESRFSTASPYLLSAMVAIRSGRFHVIWEYDAERVPRQLVARLAQEMKERLRGLTAA